MSIYMIRSKSRGQQRKYKTLPFCKVAALITYPDIRASRIIIFYDENYYKTFWDRRNPYQIWRYRTIWDYLTDLKRKIRVNFCLLM